MLYRLDTNVLSEIRRGAPNPNVQKWFTSVLGADLYVSVLALGEILQGIERLRRCNPDHAITYERWLSALLDEYGDHVLDVTAAVAEQWGRINVPDPLPVIDGLMAAAAIVSQMTFVTRNVGDVYRTGVKLLNPFE